MRDMPTDSDAWGRLALQVVEERAARGWTQADVADRGGFSVDRLQEIEKGDRNSYRPTTLGALERGLEWQPGSVRRVLLGEAPARDVRSANPVQEAARRESPPVVEDAPDTAEAIRRDPRLMDSAREHLLAQYEMLRRLSDLVGSTDIEDPETQQPLTPAERPLRAVARKRPPRNSG